MCEMTSRSKLMIITILSFLLASASSSQESCDLKNWDQVGTSVQIDMEELLEMIPFEQMLNLGMEYAMADSQVKSVLQYVSTDEFKNAVSELQESEEFVNIAEAVREYKIDAYAIANKMNSLLDMPPLHYKVGYRRDKRSPGDGLMGLVKDAIEQTPLESMKIAYRSKIDKNPSFKCLINKILSGEVEQIMSPLLGSKPVRKIKIDLENMGIPIEQLRQLISSQARDFFDLSSTIAPKTVSLTNQTELIQS